MRGNLGNREGIGKDEKKNVWTFKTLQKVWYAWICLEILVLVERW